MAQLVSCQTPILPLGTYEDIPNGAYLKDLDNILLPYVGTWEGVLNNKKYTFVLTKFTQHYSNYNLYFEDELRGNFKVTDLATNTVIYDNTATTTYDNQRIFYTYPDVPRGLIQLFFRDTIANCSNSFSFYLRNINGHPDQLTYCYFKYGSWGNGVYRDCPNYTDRSQIPVYLPQQDFVLTKL
ncbi:unnamed protein product [Rotaria socialis]|uniref:DUF6705 domain-containing protein n=1 Tax=Rotaria socialis TaxID=392032 RepID=A0A820RSH2_9BILA|nr:unnamed protein product [Rotaria socialis]CAF4439432.1 unnamed protein product [Rotaria socialis]